MRSDRLALALETGALTLPPEGPVLVLNPQTDDDLAPLPRDRVIAVQPFRPDHDVLAARGVHTFPALPPGRFAAAVVFLPRARDHALALVAEAAGAVDIGGPVVVDGQKTDGVEAVYRDLRAHVALSDPVIKAHGRLAVFRAGGGLDDWRARPFKVAGGLITRPGVFSADAPDRGSVLLASRLPEGLKGRGVDLGAGWGYLSRAVLAHPGVTHLDLVEADAVALDCARQNIGDPRAAFHWADATAFRAARPADFVVCNPPFHAGRAADPALGAAFIAAAARMLSPSGALWLVANRHLPYDRVLTGLFRQIDDLGPDASFRVTRASSPVSVSRKAKA